MPESPPSAFISYAREDLGAVRKLYNDLKRAGANPWLDVESLLPGQRWRVEIKRAIRESRYFLAVLSSNSVSRRGYVHKEVAEALELLGEFPESEIFIIPVRLDDCSPSHERLRDLQRVDMFPSWNDGVEKILRAIRVQRRGNGIPWGGIGIIAAVIGGLIALYAWLMLGEGTNFLSAWLFVTPTVTPTSSLTYIPTPTATDTPTNTPISTPVSPTNTFTPEIPTSTLTPMPINATVKAEALNLRAGPGVEYVVIGQLHQGDVAMVIGQNPGGDWLKVEHKGQTGWVAKEYVEASEKVAMVPIVEVPPTDTPASTPPPLPTSTPTPTQMPLPTTRAPAPPTHTPTTTPTLTPTATSTPTLTDTPTPLPTIGTLNFKVGFQGRDNAAGQLQNVPIKVKIKNQSGDQTLFESGWISVTPAGSSNNWGTASVDVSSAALISGQTYQVFVKGAMHLAKRITTSLTDGLTIDYTDPALNPDGFLPAGDIDQDNQVGVADVEILLSRSWGQTPPADPDPSSEVYRSDLDGNGIIHTPDLIFIEISMGTGDPY